MKCLRVRSSESEEWRLLYGSIEGFEHQAGNVYELRVTKRSVKNPPADAASSKLVLVEVVSKKPAPAGDESRHPCSGSRLPIQQR